MLAKRTRTRQSAFMATIWQHRGSLHAHPAAGVGIARSIDVDVQVSAGVLTLIYTIALTEAGVSIPAAVHPVRTDGLWQTTCCEVFIKGPDTAYFEFNLSPSGQWAAYRFFNYREGMEDAPIVARPEIAFLAEAGRLVLSAQIDLGFLPTEFVTSDWQLGLSCVVEGVDGSKAYWALNHPPEKPDFHHDDCFALLVGAAERA